MCEINLKPQISNLKSPYISGENRRVSDSMAFDLSDRFL